MKYFSQSFLAFVILIGSVLAIQNFRQNKNSKVFIDKDEVKLIADDDIVSFFVIGDWGGLPVFPFRTFIEEGVSKHMTDLAKLHNTQFQLALGDNFYFHGVKDVNDKRFKETYEDVFKSEHLKNTSWFILLGNHDHYGNPNAQVDYTKKSHRWILPSLNYTIDVKINNGKEDLMTIMMIDTVTLCGNTGYDWETDKTPRFNSLRDQLFAQEYFEAIENKIIEIGQSDVPYFLVSGHFPVWSIAEHGPTQCLLDKVRPLLHKYNVTAYLCGHDHNLQYISDVYLDHRVEYFVIGGSNFIDNTTDHINSIPPNSLKFYWADTNVVINGGFSLFKATRDNMTVTFIESTGKELYHTVIYPRKKYN